MKDNIAYIFVDDGYPEAEEYETNYVSYNMRVPGSYNRAAETANSMMAASRASKKMVFRSIAIEPHHRKHRPRSYRRHRIPEEWNRIRSAFAQLIKA